MTKTGVTAGTAHGVGGGGGGGFSPLPLLGNLVCKMFFSPELSTFFTTTNSKKNIAFAMYF